MKQIIVAVTLIFLSTVAAVVHAEQKELVMVFSGDNAGAVEPGGCGCAPKKGGLARRATFLEKIRKENKNVLVVDCGDMFSNKKNSPELRAETISKSFGIMKYDAINTGETDFVFGADALIKFEKTDKLNLVSSNLKVQGNKETIKPYIIRKFDGFKVGITGVTDPAFLNADEKDVVPVRKGDAAKELKQTLSDMKGKTDFVILLSHLGEEESQKFIDANDLENVYVAVSGHGRGLFVEPKKVKNTFVVQNSLSGESLGILKIRLNDKLKPESCTLENDPLGQTIADHAEIAGLVKNMENEISKTVGAKTQKEINEKRVKEEAEMKKMLNLTPEQFMEKIKSGNGGTIPVKN